MKIKNKSLSDKSKKWLKRHLKDEFVKKSKEEKYRSRAAYKLIEIDKKFNLLKSCKSAVDLGAAPGSWSEVLVERLKSPTKIVAIDLLDIKPLKNVEIIKGDFRSNDFANTLKNNGPFELLLSDASPNLTGNKTADFLQSLELIENIFEIALKDLSVGGHLVAKYFRSGDIKDLILKAKKNFAKVTSFKPDSSRKESSEIYLVCLKKKSPLIDK
jgi:23S rRNA (uridine2552-2'-O)-methyltransferase|tara:strand:+ start:723 stop:1364 length:642 start_codon:yes stop_codon:yes gene_type:complete